MNENENSKNIPESNDFDWDLSETEIPETEKPSQKYQAKPDDQDEAEELIDALISKALGSLGKSYNADLEALSDSIFNEIQNIKNNKENSKEEKSEEEQMRNDILSLLYSSFIMLGLNESGKLKNLVKDFNIDELVDAINMSDADSTFFCKKLVAQPFSKDEFLNEFAEDDYIPASKLFGIVDKKFIATENSKFYPVFWDVNDLYVVLRERFSSDRIPVFILMYKNESGVWKADIERKYNLYKSDENESSDIGSSLLKASDILNFTLGQEKTDEEDLKKYITELFPQAFQHVFFDFFACGKNKFDLFIPADKQFYNITNIGTVEKSDERIFKENRVYVGKLKINDNFDGHNFLQSLDLDDSKLEYDFYIELDNSFCKEFEPVFIKDDVVNKIDFSAKFMENYKLRIDVDAQGNIYFYIKF